MQVQYLNRNTNTSIVGTTSNYSRSGSTSSRRADVHDRGGHAPSSASRCSGPRCSRTSASSRPKRIIGEPIRIRGIQFTVVGVLKSKGQAQPFSNPDDQVLIPLQTARFRVIGSDRLRSISVLAAARSGSPRRWPRSRSMLRREHRLRQGRPDDFQIRNQADFLNTFAETTQVFTYLLAGIAAVSLLVGGIGIMNIMLVSVTERTREIGVRKALGATRLNILLQFLIEAVVLCLLGGLLGVLLGTGVADVAEQRRSSGTPTSRYASVVLAFGFSAVVGVLFGVWPARRAAKLDPILALRYE